ncbi:MAG: phosphoribosyltransferase family protein [Candidatus Daviesbacteria bacterium]|nr:phosphoribosyltransferase family protein [Candidatus Daviesbacteria bacterium]
MEIFKDRQAAGELLANRLKNTKADIVLGIPRGGVVVAAKLAKDLNLPFDIIVTRKIGAPGQVELALGALDPDGQVIWDQELLDELEIEPEELKQKIDTEMTELRRREKLYRQGRSPLDISGKTIILADDGMATGSTTLAAVKYLKRHGAKIILAVPVASSSALKKVENEVESNVVLQIPEYFQAVGQFYSQFESVTDEEVIELLNGR